MKKNFIISSIIISVITFVSGKEFLRIREVPLPIIDESKVKVMMLSDYSPNLKGTNGDTPIYYMKGKEEGGSLLVMGGTHASEPSGHIAAISMIESLDVGKGDVYIIPYANRSAASHNMPGYGNLNYYTLKTQSGKREFKGAHRRTNPIDQWPSEDYYYHSGKRFKGYEARNLNRVYPGRVDGNFTEKIAYAVTNFIREKDIDITIDFHEASPESKITNVMIFHPKVSDIGSSAVMNMQLEGIDIRPELSNKSNIGLTHWELGNRTNTYPFLFETINPSQGRWRGRSTEDQIVKGQDNNYVRFSEAGRLRIPYTDEGYSMTERVARQIIGVNSVLMAVTEFEPSKEIYFDNLPTYDEYMTNGIGAYLK